MWLQRPIGERPSSPWPRGAFLSSCFGPSSVSVWFLQWQAHGYMDLWIQLSILQLEAKSGKENEVSWPDWLSSCALQQGGFQVVMAMWRFKCAIIRISMLQVWEEQLTAVMLQSAGKALYLRQTQTAALWMLPLPHCSPVLPESCPSTCGT